MSIYVMGRRGSDYRKKVDKWLGNVNLNQATAAFNYGLQGQKLRDFMDEPRHAKLDNLPIINHVQFGNKYDCVKAVRGAGMPAPMSWKYRERADIDVNKLIVKPYYSLGGKGIRRVDSVDDVTEDERRTHYLQEEITNRRYELRCIAMAWVPPEKWLFQKRVHDGGEEVLAWNNHNGGKFITVENPDEPLFQRVRDDVKKMLPLFGYGFGAVDFIVQNNPGGKLKHFFIEWNLAPGWTMERTENWYKPNFLKLQTFKQEEIEAFAEGILLEDLKDGDRRDRGFGQRGQRGPRLGGIQFEYPDMPMPDWGEIEERHMQRDMVERPDVASLAEMYEIDGVPYHDRYLGPVLAKNAGTYASLKVEGYLDKYHDISCPNCNSNIYVMRANMDIYCPSCGYTMRSFE